MENIMASIAALNALLKSLRQKLIHILHLSSGHGQLIAMTQGT